MTFEIFYTNYSEGSSPRTHLLESFPLFLDFDSTRKQYWTTRRVNTTKEYKVNIKYIFIRIE